MSVAADGLTEANHNFCQRQKCKQVLVPLCSAMLNSTADVHICMAQLKFVANFVAIYPYKDCLFVLQLTRFCGKIILRRN